MSYYKLYKDAEEEIIRLLKENARLRAELERLTNAITEEKLR